MSFCKIPLFPFFESIKNGAEKTRKPLIYKGLRQFNISIVNYTKLLFCAILTVTTIKGGRGNIDIRAGTGKLHELPPK